MANPISMMLAKFWDSHPALLYGLSVLLFIGAALNENWIILIPLICLAGIHQIRLLLVLCLGLSVFFLVNARYQFPEMTSEDVMGTAEVELSSLSFHKKNFGNLWIYHGILRAFVPDNETKSIARDLPISVSFLEKEGAERPSCDASYFISGALRKTDYGSYSIAKSHKSPWVLIKENWSWGECRFKAKKWVKDYIESRITKSRSRSFLSGLATGNFSDKQIWFEFSRFGLQHIMAISGFHFAILASMLSFFLGLFLSKKTTSITLIFCLSSYFLFLGTSPSVMRSWIAIVIVLLGNLLERTSDGLNSLGMALLAILVYDPFLALHIGFQFSFCATAAILLLYPTCDYYLQKIFPKRTLGQALSLDRVSQHGYCILVFIRQGLALTAAVNLAAMPLTLYHFHKVPLMSVVYNLFFPFLVSISMFLLLVSLFLDMLFLPLGAMVHHFNSAYTNLVLDFTFNLPMSFDFILRVSDLPIEALIIYFTFVLVVGVITRQRLDVKKADLQDLVFV